jgi:hypothetical protein
VVPSRFGDPGAVAGNGSAERDDLRDPPSLIGLLISWRPGVDCQR